MLNDKRRSLLNSALFRAYNRTERKTISLFSLALIFTFDFAALSERRSCPEDRSRRFVLLGALDAALRQRTYPVRTVMQFSRFRCDCKTILAKNIALSRISKRSENAPKNADFHAYGQDRKGQKIEGRTPLCSQNSPFRNGLKTCAEYGPTFPLCIFAKSVRSIVPSPSACLSQCPERFPRFGDCFDG